MSSQCRRRFVNSQLSGSLERLSYLRLENSRCRLTLEALEERCLLAVVWQEVDGDGVRELGEAGLAGATVELFNPVDGVIANGNDISLGTRLTDGSGIYNFGTIDPGSYYLSFRAPVGFVFTIRDAGGDDAKDSDANVITGYTSVFTIAAAQPITTHDAGVMFNIHLPPANVTATIQNRFVTPTGVGTNLVDGDLTSTSVGTGLIVPINSPLTFFEVTVDYAQPATLSMLRVFGDGGGGSNPLIPGFFHSVHATFSAFDTTTNGWITKDSVQLPIGSPGYVGATFSSIQTSQVRVTFTLVGATHQVGSFLHIFEFEGIGAPNSTPLSANAGGPYSVDEGSVSVLTGSGAGGNSPLTYTWDLDGDALFGETGADATRGNESGPSPTYSAAGLDGPITRTVALRLVDGSGASATSTTTIAIQNMAPTATAGGPYHSTFGSLLSLTASGSDPGGLGDPLDFAWDLDLDGSFGETGAAAARGNETGIAPSVNLAGITAGTLITISLRVTDGDGGIGTDAALVTVGAPALISGQIWRDTNGNGIHGTSESGLNGWTVEFVKLSTGQVVATAITADADLNSDSFIDPVTERGIFLSPALPPDSYVVREVLPAGWQQTYPTSNIHLVHVAEGVSHSGPKFGNRLNNFYVTAFIPTATGFVATFNRDLDASALNLFDQDNMLGIPDVAMSGANSGAIRGSLVVDDGLRKITFIKTGGLLVGDNYTVTFRSDITAFKDTTGLLLDGNNDETGGDVDLRGFTQNNPPTNAIELSVADFTRGYGQAVNLPASNLGLPITISNAQGVKSASFTLNYNPTLLNITGATLGSGITGNVTLDTSTSGVAQISVTSANGLSLTAGLKTLVSLTASVPSSAPYGQKHLLDLANLQLLDTSPVPVTLPAIDDDGIHIAAYFGDANGSQGYNAPDATGVQRLIVGLDTGFASYQLADPYLIADITGNGQVQSEDVTQIQRAIVGLSTPDIPPHPGLSAPATGGPDPIISIPQNLTASVGETVVVPVELLVTEPTGIELAGTDLAIAYDASSLELTDTDVGQLLIGFGLSVNTTVPGLIRLSLAGSPLDLPYAAEGVLATLQFNVLAGFGTTSSINLLQSAATLQTALYDSAGRALTLAPAPTNGDHDEVDGLISILGNAQPAAAWELPAVDMAFDGENDFTADLIEELVALS